jgi:predicted Zn-dependent protease with MMP-like domain
VRFKDFERSAREAFEEIPEEYLEGIDGLVVLRETHQHPTLPDVFTLGECLTEQHLSEYGGPDTTRSLIALYWGSFQELAKRDEDFDWEGELWETLTHELRHHLESLAGDDALEDVDYAADELFKRQDGEPFDPWYWQSGEDLGDGVFVVERGHYLEREWDPKERDPETDIEFRWRGSTYRIPRPAEMGDVHFVGITGPDFEGDGLEVVLVRRRGWWEGLRGMLGARRAPVVLESEVDAKKVALRPAG